MLNLDTENSTLIKLFMKKMAVTYSLVKHLQCRFRCFYTQNIAGGLFVSNYL